MERSAFIELAGLITGTCTSGLRSAVLAVRCEEQNEVLGLKGGEADGIESCGGGFELQQFVSWSSVALFTQRSSMQRDLKLKSARRTWPSHERSQD